MALSLALCLLASVSAFAGQRRDLKEEDKRRDQLLNDPGRYEAMIEAYRAGDTAASVELMADPEWDARRLTVLFHHLDTVAMPQDFADVLWRVAPMLHIDVALRLSPALESDDGQAAMHLGFAGELLRLGIRERGDSIRLLAERLYVALARLLQDKVAPYTAERLLRVARERVPDRASILYASGSLAELFATDYALATTNTAPRSAASGRGLQLKQLLQKRTGYLNDAAQWLRRAATLAPDQDLIRVHLGRVLALRHDDEEAFAILNGVHTTTTDDAIGYLAAVFIGGLRERQGRLDDAEKAYRSALDRFPSGHAAAVGLSEVLQRTRRGGEARDVLHRLVSETPGPTREPLWWYHFDPPGVADARLAALRNEVRQ